MKVRIVPDRRAVTTIKLKDGTILNNDDIDTIEVQPFFAFCTGLGVAYTAHSLNDKGTELDTVSYRTNGRTGVIQSQKIPSSSAVPMVDGGKPPVRKKS